MTKRKKQNIDEITLRNTRQGLSFPLGLGLGIGTMYYFDPDVGTRRRAVLRDKFSHVTRSSSVLLDKAIRDVGHRLEGLLARMLGVLDREPVADQVLVARVRSAMGRKVSHPHAIHVDAQDGVVRLSGPILGTEVDPLLRCVRRVRGVRDLIDRLEVHEDAENVPSLQGEGSITRPRTLQENWSPATRVFATGFGFSMAMSGLRRGGFMGTLMMIAGAGVAVRSITNLPARRIVGIGAGRRAIDLHKTITVHAPIDEVFRFWTQLENFPRFMQHVRDIRVLGGDLSHWRVAGPAGISVEWDAVVTRHEPNRVFAWKTVPASTVEHAGIIRFEEVPEGTRLDIRMSYNPPAGVLGHVIASLFRSDPKHAMDDDLVRMKSLLEEGKASAHGSQVTLAELH